MLYYIATMNRDNLPVTTSTKLSTPKDVIDLYTKIPDYAQVKHLGNSEFINTLERLKDEFREIRASLYEDSLNGSDIDLDTDEKIRNLKSGDLNKKKDGRFRLPVSRPTTAKVSYNNIEKFGSDALGLNNQQYLSITSCPLHAAPVHYNYQQHHNDDALRRNNYLLATTRASASAAARPVNFRNMYYDSKTDSAFQDDDDDDIEAGHGRRIERYSPAASSKSSGSESTPTMSTTVSIWSSNPEICRTSYLDYVPPTNIERRIQWRNAKSLSRSEPQLYNKSKDNGSKEGGDPTGVHKSQIIHFKAHPVPDHVHQPLFDKIMLRNKLRSEQVRQESKQRLLAQVKPFSFTATATSPATLRRNTNMNTTAMGNERERKSLGHGFGSKMNKNFFSSNRNHELYLLTKKEMLEGLNNTKPCKPQQKQTLQQCLRAHHHGKTYESPSFRAKPAPPRNRALLAAVRLREQQEYRELKKRLRAEALMKTSSLPPSMAARDKRQKATQAKIKAILNILESNSRVNAQSRRRRISTSSTDDAGASLNTDDDAGGISDDEQGLTSSLSSKAADVDDKKCEKNQRSRNKSFFKGRPKNFTSYGPSKCAPKQDGVFESTAVDNHASRLRVQAARRREQDRIQREQGEQVRLQKMEDRRQRLRVWHMPAWKHASSYSSTQDISMRCELRLAASILEKEAFRRDMNNMLTRVQSAPLLLEGVRERKYELCKKHRAEFAQDTTPRSYRIYSPRNLPEKVHWGSTAHVGFIDDQYGNDKSETAAIAEGSCSSNSDNECVKNMDMDSNSAAAVDNNNEGEEDTQRAQTSESYHQNGNGNLSKTFELEKRAKSPLYYNETVELLNEDLYSRHARIVDILTPSPEPEREEEHPERDSPPRSDDRKQEVDSEDADFFQDRADYTEAQGEALQAAETKKNEDFTSDTAISTYDTSEAPSPSHQEKQIEPASDTSAATSYVAHEPEPEVEEIDDESFFD